MTGFTLPLFLIFGKRPVKFVSTADGGMDVLAFNWESGKFERDMSYLSKYFKHSPEVEEVNEAKFNSYVKKLLEEIEKKSKKI